MSRTRPDDWLCAGLELLQEGGEYALTLDALCAKIGRTKGSFYHHFTDVPEFLDRLLAFWEDKNTLAPIVVADAEKSPERRRAALYTAVRELDLQVELAIQAWALRDDRARKVRARVDARRVDYLAGLHRSAGVPPKRAEQLAQLEYATFLGAIQLFVSAGADGWRKWRELNALLLEGLSAPRGSRRTP